MTTVPPVPSPRPAEEIRADLLIVRHASDEDLVDDTAYRLWHDIEPLLADRERLSAELADAQAETESLETRITGQASTISTLRQVAAEAGRVMATLEEYGPGIVGHLLDTDNNAGERLRELLREVSLWALGDGTSWRERAVAAERALEAVRAVLAELVRLKDGPRDDAYRAAKESAWAAARAALSAASPTTSDDGEACGVMATGVMNAPVGPCVGRPGHRGVHSDGRGTTWQPIAKSAASDEPARCPHGHTEGHRYSRDGVYVTSWCPGSAASGTPETTR